jgi:hypothetical protein
MLFGQFYVNYNTDVCVHIHNINIYYKNAAQKLFFFSVFREESYACLRFVVTV